ncbi:hypothetical protein HXX76_013167 [Chlamydomonas incerta]|uniref:Uncharacterized protein n=1 Tax=Chlamydomonas incerta TaxID=51695 RepID=A0A835SUQ7_CHLIN|nr:hypothetical protein HXX76_013167 [Chlamydomonas incerta]|eukprot:KAG2426186.1 hypothetical protein HXX76_013167 [Chlamydomonas incerta]
MLVQDNHRAHITCSSLQQPAAVRCPAASIRAAPVLHGSAAAVLSALRQRQHLSSSSFRSFQQPPWRASCWALAAAPAARAAGPSASEPQPSAALSAPELALGPDAGMEAVVRAAVGRMGRAFGPKEQALVELLNDNYYDTVQSVVELREEETAGLARDWGVPLRLLKEVRALCSLAVAGGGGGGGGGPQPPERATAPTPPAHQGPAQASASALASSSSSSSPSGVAVAAVAAAAAAALPAAASMAGRNRDVEASGAEAAWTGAEVEGAAEEEAEEVEWSEEDEEAAAGEGEDEDGEEDGEDNGAATAGDSSSGSTKRGRRAPLPEPAPDVAGVPIMERRCPDKFRFGFGSGRSVRLTERGRKAPYSLKSADTPPALAAELRAFELFCLHGSWEAAAAAAGEPLRRVTVANHVQCLRQALGWLHEVEGVPLSELCLGALLPGRQQGAARRVHAFLIWLETERGVCKRTVSRSLGAVIAAAKFLFHEASRVSKGDKPYSDVEVIKTLRSMYMTYERHARVSGHVVDTAAKWLDWPQYLALVAELRREAAGLKLSGAPRAPAEVAMSLQAFLLAAILACVPDRQRTLRELQVGRTLVKDGAGTWFIRHGHADYKTGGTYGERPPLVIDPGIYQELEEFIGTWRAHLKPRHDFLFTKRDGSGPLSAAELARSFSLNAFRLTGRKVNPHMVRDMVVTYARSGHATEHELEALAVYMGHSLAEQRGTYDRRTKAQKVAPALGLLAKISAGSNGGVSSGGGSSGSASGGGSGSVAAPGKAGAATGAATKAGVRLATVEPAAPVASVVAAAEVRPAARRARKSNAAEQPAGTGTGAAGGEDGTDADATAAGKAVGGGGAAAAAAGGEAAAPGAAAAKPRGSRAKAKAAGDGSGGGGGAA